MQHLNPSRLKLLVPLLTIGTLALVQPGCSTLTPSQNGALLVGAETLADIAGAAAATYYGGPAAGQLASAGLSALGSVLQGYVGKPIPSNIVKAAPGIANLGIAVAEVVAPNHIVSQNDVTIADRAAALLKASVAATPSGASK